MKHILVAKLVCLDITIQFTKAPSILPFFWQVSGKIFQTTFRNRKIPFNIHGVAFYRKKVDNWTVNNNSFFLESELGLLHHLSYGSVFNFRINCHPLLINMQILGFEFSTTILFRNSLEFGVNVVEIP